MKRIANIAILLKFPEHKLFPQSAGIGSKFDLTKVLYDAVDDSLIIKIELWRLGQLFSLVFAERRQQRKDECSGQDIEIAFDLAA